MIINTRQYAAYKNYVARSKVKVTVGALCFCVLESCPTHNSLCMVGFKNYLAEMIIMTRWCVTRKNHAARSKVKVTVGT